MGISLSKGNSISLKKADGSALTRVMLGLGWDQVKRGFFGGGGEADLDASAILYKNDGSTEIVYYGKLNSNDGSVNHTGDNLTGAGEGDDEQIIIDLPRVDANVQSIVFTINSYSGHKFDKIENVFARVVDVSAGNNEVVRYNLAESNASTANVIAKITRTPSGWDFAAIGEYTDGRTAANVVDVARRYV